MPHGLNNWLFENVVAFLQQHFFIERPGIKSGHRYYKGFVDDTVRLCEVQFHAGRPISPKSLQHDIIPRSGIPERYWKDYANAGNKKLRKRVQYPGAKHWPS